MHLPDGNPPPGVTHPHRSARTGQTVARGGALVSAIAIAVATLRPGTPGATPRFPVTCLVCGEAGGADVVRNVVLFLPFGIACMAALMPAEQRRWRAAGVILTGFLYSFGIETAQYFVALRDARPP